MLGSQGVEKSERMIHEGRPVGELAFFFGMRHLGEDMSDVAIIPHDTRPGFIIL